MRLLSDKSTFSRVDNFFKNEVVFINSEKIKKGHQTGTLTDPRKSKFGGLPCNNNTTNSTQCQSPIEKELAEKFEPKKLASEPLVLSYYRLGMEKRAETVASCGTFLEFAEYVGASGGLPLGADRSSDYKLHKANFCKDRLCPMCSWRRSYKIFGQVSKIMNVIAEKYNFLFLTLTVINCEGSKLSETLDTMSKAFIRMFRQKRLKNVVRGFFRALEITYNEDNNTFHPHFHCVLAVPKSYFKGDLYIQRDEWLEMWQNAMNDPRITQVDIRKAKDKHHKDGKTASEALASAVAEVAKYTVKSSDYLKKDESLTDSLVSTFSNVLYHRRLVSLSGCFKEAHKQLQLDDVENGDLIHLNDNIRPDVAVQILRYGWSCGCYKLMSVSAPVIECDE